MGKKKFNEMSTEEVDAMFPECAKLAGVHNDSQNIGEFLDWLETTKGIRLAVWRDVASGEDEDDGQDLVLDFTTKEQLLAEYFKINMDTVEAERGTMLERIRAEA